MIRYDGHTHTIHSHDGKQSTAELCAAAEALGLSGVTVTDHADLWYAKETKLCERIVASVNDVKSERGRHGKLEVFTGVELAEAIDNPALAENLLLLADYDEVIGSVHCVKYADYNDAYSHINFGIMSDEAITSYLGAYFDAVLKTAETVDYDCLAHLTCPLRNITGSYGRAVDLSSYAEVIREILSAVVRRGKSLEINTKAINRGDPLSTELLSLYRSLGGELITFGSDAHETGALALDFAEGERAARAVGFTYYVYYRQRKPVSVPFENGHQ